MSETNREKSIMNKNLENDDLVIEDNTIYEVDLDCYECLRKERKKIKKNESESKS